MLCQPEGVAFPDLSLSPTAGWNTAQDLFSFHSQHLNNDSGASHFSSLRKVPQLLRCSLPVLCPSWTHRGSGLCVHRGPCVWDWQYFWVLFSHLTLVSWLPSSTQPAKHPLRAYLHQQCQQVPVLPAPLLLPRSTPLKNLCCPLDVCFPIECRFAVPLLYFVRASCEIVSCQLNLRWWKAWSWETTQHWNLCLFCQLVVHLVCKINEIGEMGFPSLRWRLCMNNFGSWTLKSKIMEVLKVKKVSTDQRGMSLLL